MIKFHTEDIDVVSGKEATFKIRKYAVVNGKVPNFIGEPVPYKDFNKKKVAMLVIRNLLILTLEARLGRGELSPSRK